MPAGYGDAILSIEACKQHLRVLHDIEDDLIAALRDASIEYVERYCGVKLGPVEGLTWRAQSVPSSASQSVELAMRPITAITGIGWQDGNGVPIDGNAADYRATEHGALRPGIGKAWPSGVGGEVVVTFNAGYPGVRRRNRCFWRSS